MNCLEKIFHTELKSLENFMNSMHRNIMFATEMEQNNSNQFFDHHSSRLNNRHKQPHTDITIDNYPVQPFRQKIEAYNSMVHRLLTFRLQ